MKKYKLSKHQPIKSIWIGLIAALLQTLVEIIAKNGDIFAMSYKSLINSLLIATLSYLTASFFRDERNLNQKSKSHV